MSENLNKIFGSFVFKIMPYPVPHKEISLYSEFKEYVNKIKDDEKIYFYFTGRKKDDGVSWCMDCAVCEPLIKEAIERHKDVKVIFVDIGGPAEWRTLENPYRADKDVHLTTIPTIILWKSVKRLDGSYLIRQKDVLEMIFSNEEEN